MNKDTSPLLPSCAYCGETVEVFELGSISYSKKYWYWSCPECGINRQSHCQFKTKEQAIADASRRPAPASPSAPDVVEAARAVIAWGDKAFADGEIDELEKLRAALSHNGERSDQATEAKIKELRTALKECRPHIEMIEDSSDEWTSKDCRRIMGLIDAALNGEPDPNSKEGKP